jgi:FAD-dependent oxidoreductase domain-containing protein 1
MVAERVDVAIIGGGVIGSAIACALAAQPGFSGSIVVLERDPSYRTAASALSVSSIRQQFSTPINIALSLHSIAFLRQAARHLAVEGEPAPDIALKEPGISSGHYVDIPI